MIQKSGAMKRYKLNVQIYLGEKKIKKLLFLLKDGGMIMLIIMLLILIKVIIFIVLVLFGDFILIKMKIS